jgi:hypothetical protein
MDPGAHGGTIATADGTSIELLEIQPVRAYVGDREAAEVGFPFWTKGASFYGSDLDLTNEHVKRAREYHGLDDETLETMTPEGRAVAIACALLSYGHGEEGEGGFAKDILGSRRVRWYHGKRPRGWRYLASEDQEFRRMVRGGTMIPYNA